MFMLILSMFGILNALGYLLSLQSLQEAGEPINMVFIKSSDRGLKEGWTRATFILRSDYLEKIKALAYWDRKQVKEVIDEALGLYLKGKKIKPGRNK